MSAKDGNDTTRADRLEELALALKQAQLMLLEQSARLDSLDKSGDQSERELQDMRQQLSTVIAERDQLQKQLLALERLQTETIALPEDTDEDLPVRTSLPTIEDLMADRPDPMLADGETSGRLPRLNGPSAEAPETDWGEMISPEVIAPEVFDAQDPAPEATSNKPTSRLLVSMDSEQPMKIPLHEGTMTIGRSESAHIRLDGEYVSRIHVRIICRAGDTVIEDAGSKNGFKINSVAVKRRNLSHGDVITIGKRRFTFVDTAQED